CLGAANLSHGRSPLLTYMRDMGSTQKWRNRKRETLRRVELYSSAYKLAWEQISSTERRERPNIPLLIHASIRRQLKAGVTDAHLIAFKALKDALGPDTY